MTQKQIIRWLRRLRTRQERQRTGTFYIEGARIVAQAIEAGAAIETGIVAPALVGSAFALKTVEALRQKGVPVVELSAQDFKNISFKENLQGIGAVVHSRIETLPPDPEPATWVALDGVGNPGNLGAIMRSADAVGAGGVILPGNTVDPYHPEAVRASMGSLFALRIIRADFDALVDWKRGAGLFMVGTSPYATLDYDQVAYPQAVILLMGSERTGLPQTQQTACDTLVRIPMIGTCDSLNLGVAASILLYEFFRQRKPPG